MGGNALKASHGFETRRIQASEYHEQILPAISRTLTQLFPRSTFAAIPSYGDKPDFGDVDILLETGQLPSQWVQQVIERFGPKAWVKNGNVLSFEFREFQVDLIAVPGEEFNWTQRYFAFNDLGNLIGRVAHKMGFKFGHDGFWYVVRDEEHSTHVVEEIRVTLHQWERALDLLGFDPAVYARGFSSLQSIFDFVIHSRFFNRDIYLLENRNHASRIRDRKRKTYTAFLDHLEALPNLPAYAWSREKQVYLETAFDVFPSFRQAHAAALVKRDRQKAVRLRFNGDRVRELTGLEGQALGEYIRDLRRSFASPADFDAFVLEASSEELDRFISLA